MRRPPGTEVSSHWAGGASPPLYKGCVCAGQGRRKVNIKE